MNSLVENNCIKKIECGVDFSYILEDGSMFLSTEYKVLQSQADSCFVKCMKMLYNGKIQLVYLTKGLKSFASMFSALEAESFLIIVSNLFSDIVDVKSNGFLSCQNIDIAFEHIFIDPATYKVYLIYLPLNRHFYEDYSSFENELRTGFVKLIAGIPALSSAKTAKLSEELSNGTYSIEDICSHIKYNKGAAESRVLSNAGTQETHCGKILHITAMNAPRRVEISVTKDSFVIGKKAELCDGIVDFNNMISRKHCQINRQGNHYTITDLQSSNGTYVNGVRLQPNKSFPIENGDIIRLADSDFQVRIS